MPQSITASSTLSPFLYLSIYLSLSLSPSLPPSLCDIHVPSLQTRQEPGVRAGYASAQTFPNAALPCVVLFGIIASALAQAEPDPVLTSTSFPAAPSRPCAILNAVTKILQSVVQDRAVHQAELQVRRRATRRCTRAPTLRERGDGGTLRGVHRVRGVRDKSSVFSSTCGVAILYDTFLAEPVVFDGMS